jgi:simple sugar transport system ATP-binding protein
LSTDHDLINMKDITIKFNDRIVLDNVNFSIKPGEVIGILGDNGAGKSTLVKTLIGLYKQDSGDIYLKGKKVKFHTIGDAISAGIEISYQEPTFGEGHDITRNFFAGREIEKKVGPFNVLDIKSMDSELQTILSSSTLNQISDLRLKVSKLSNGMRRMLSVVKANWFAKSLLILDEPTTALSEIESSALLTIIRRAKDKGVAVIFITHKAHEVFNVADRLVILRNGKVFRNISKKDISLKELDKLLIYPRLTILREMTASVSHQIKNPLGIMKVASEMLQDGLNNQEGKIEYQKISKILLSEIDKLNFLVDDFINFATPLKVSKKLNRVDDLLDSAVESVSETDGRGIDFIRAIQPNLPEYEFDSGLIKQAVDNLVRNAIQATAPGGKIEVRAFVKEDRLNIQVEDWGQGIDDEIKPQIFNPYFTTKTQGSGLGLSIVEQILLQHNSSITFTSEPHSGTVFTITI